MAREQSGTGHCDDNHKTESLLRQECIVDPFYPSLSTGGLITKLTTKAKKRKRKHFLLGVPALYHVYVCHYPPLNTLLLYYFALFVYHVSPRLVLGPPQRTRRVGVLLNISKRREGLPELANERAAVVVVEIAEDGLDGLGGFLGVVEGDAAVCGWSVLGQVERGSQRTHTGRDGGQHACR